MQTNPGFLAGTDDGSWGFERLTRGPHSHKEKFLTGVEALGDVPAAVADQVSNTNDIDIQMAATTEAEATADSTDPANITEEDDREDLNGADTQNIPANSGNGNVPDVPNTDHFVWVDRGDAVDESSDCKLCMTTLGSSGDPLYVECGHVWCKSCLNQYFAQSFTNRERFPPRCCRPEGFNLEVIGMHLDDEVLIHIMDKWEEWTTTDPTYCSNMQCNVFVPEYRVDGQWAVCLSCKAKTCVECKEGEARHPAPDQHPDPEKNEENAKLADVEGWKYCPNRKCNRIVEKIEGCDTMTCKCGQKFCYRCGNSLGDPYPCTCNGQNAWVGEVQAWANGADGAGWAQANTGEEDDEEVEDESESETDEDEEGSDSEESDEDDNEGEDDT